MIVAPLYDTKIVRIESPSVRTGEPQGSMLDPVTDSVLSGPNGPVLALLQSLNPQS